MQGEELKALRKAMDLSQATLAKGLGLTGTFVGLMERGEKPIEPRTALAARFLYEHPEARPDPDDEDDVSTFRIYSISDLMKLHDDATRLFDGRQWGRWRFGADSLTLDLDSRLVIVDRVDGEDVIERRESYYVRLCEMTNAKRVVDWIGQINGKGWGSPAVGDFVQALDDIFDLQATFTHGKGFASEDAVAELLKGKIEEAPQADEA